jgi:hypothetical protein
MKQIRMIIFFLFCAWLSFSHAQTTFNRLYDTNNSAELALKSLEYEDGYIVYGEGGYKRESRRSIMFRKIDFFGNLLWEKYYDEIGIGKASRNIGVIKLNSEDILVCGFLTDSLLNDDDAFLFRLSPLADSVFFKRYFSNRLDAFYAVKEINHKFYISGVSRSQGDIAGDVYVVKTDSMGNIEWDTTYGGAGVLDEGYSIDYTAEGNLIIGAGSAQFSPKPYSPWVIAIDTTGAIQWQRQYGTQAGSDCGAIVKSSEDGGSILFSCIDTIVSSGAEEKVEQIVKLDDNGNVVWRKIFDNSVRRLNYFLEELNSGDIVFGGSIRNNEGREVGWLYKTDANGNELWQRQYQSKINDTLVTNRAARLWNIEETSDGGLIAVGSAFGTSNASDFWVLKLDAYGCVESGCQVGVNDPQTPKGGLVWVYPNPASTQTLVSIKSNKQAHAYKEVVFKLYDVSGKEIYTQTSTLNTSAYSEYYLNTAAFQIGFYFYTVTTGSEVIGKGKLVRQ